MHTVEVAATRLDSLLRSLHTIDLLKVDVEGFELAVLCSAHVSKIRRKARIRVELRHDVSQGCQHDQTFAGNAHVCENGECAGNQNMEGSDRKKSQGVSVCCRIKEK